MNDLGATLLHAALGYAQARVGALLDPADLAAALGVVPLPPDALDAVVADLAQAQAESDQLAAALAGPVTLANGRAAAGHLIGAITALRAAATELDAGDDNHLSKAMSTVPDPAGLVGQLGLTAPPRVQVDAADSLTYTLVGNAVAVAEVVRIARVSLVARAGTAGELSLTLELDGVQLSLGSHAGAVLDAVLGAAGLSVTSDLRFSIDTTRGLTAQGTLGPISVPTRSQSSLLKDVAAKLVLEDPGRGLYLTARAEGRLGGVVTVLADGFGVHFPLDADGLGALVPVPPDSLGLDISAGPVTGGGFISVRHVPEGRRYSGALRLRIGPVDVKAYGVLTDRGTGFSLAVVMSIEFVPPIEITHGFTLNGVGGIVGLDVRIDTEAMRSQLRSGALDNLMFPPDPIAAAPAILETLATVFPPSPGGLGVGPMLQLGWGRPVSFVKLDLVVMLALPDPAIILLARLRVAIPLPEAPLVNLKAEVYGEFSSSRILVQASLVDSTISGYSVSGDIGILVRFGDDATFAISAGGFHPRYTAPPELAGMRRISMELSPPVGVQLRVEGYLAVTTNTVQFGGRVDLAYSAGIASVYGYASLDALIRFDPFGFELDTSASVGVEVLGHTLVAIDLALHLAGPAPWRVHGTGRVRLPWPLPDPSISFGPKEWGVPAPSARPTVSPVDLVADALSEPSAWSRVDGHGRPSPVTLRDVTPDSQHVLVDPWSLIRGTQTAVPLDTEIVRVGGARVAPGETRVLLGDPLIADVAGAHWSVDKQPFPLGQYLDLADDVALSAPSFEQHAAGLVIDPADLVSPTAPPVQVDLSYETSYPGEPTAIPTQRGSGIFTRYESEISLAATSAGRSALRQASRYDAPHQPIAVAAASEVRPASTATLATIGGVSQPIAWSNASALVGRLGLSAADVQLVGAGV